VSSIASVTLYATVCCWGAWLKCARVHQMHDSLMPGRAHTCACAVVRAAEVLGSPPDDTHIRCAGCGAAAVGLRRCARWRQVQYCR
jgi:malic enzyme